MVLGASLRRRARAKARAEARARAVALALERRALAWLNTIFPPRPIRIYVDVVGGGFALELTAMEDATIDSVKNAIFSTARPGIPANQQRLTFAGIQLEDDSTLEDSGVRDGSTLRLNA